MHSLRPGMIAALLSIPLLATASPPAGQATPPEAPGAGPASAAAARPSEPASTVDLSARLLDLPGQGATRRALVEIGIFSRREIENLRLERSEDGASGVRTEVEIPGTSRRIAALGARKVQVALDLEEGRVHHLRFFAEGEDATGAALRASAYLRVNLDPALAPRHVDLEDRELLEYGPSAGGR